MIDKEFVIRFTLSDLGKGIIFSPILIILIASLMCLPWGNTNAPAWVQAIGSVLAIIVAVWVAQLQASGQKRTIQAQNIEFAKKLSIILKQAFEGAHRAGGALDDPSKVINQSIFDRLKYGNRIVHNVNPISLPTAELMSKWLSIKGILQLLENDFEVFLHAANNTDEEQQAKEIKRHALRVNRQYFVRLRGEFDALVEEFSGCSK